MESYGIILIPTNCPGLQKSNTDLTFGWDTVYAEIVRHLSNIRNSRCIMHRG